jgi:hypothetical protein
MALNGVRFGCWLFFLRTIGIEKLFFKPAFFASVIPFATLIGALTTVFLLAAKGTIEVFAPGIPWMSHEKYLTMLAANQIVP